MVPWLGGGAGACVTGGGAGVAGGTEPEEPDELDDPELLEPEPDEPEPLEPEDPEPDDPDPLECEPEDPELLECEPLDRELVDDEVDDEPPAVEPAFADLPPVVVVTEMTLPSAPTTTVRCFTTTAGLAACRRT